VVTRQLQVERGTGKVRRSKTGILPLCHTTNAADCCSGPGGEIGSIYVCVCACPDK